MHDKTDYNTIQEVVVVEGYHDLALLKRVFPTLDVVITNGSEISQTTLDELKTLQETRGLILFLDPDFQGERIRRIITEYIGPTKHAFLPQSECISKNKKKVGIEHASETNIRKALEAVKTQTIYQTSTLEMRDMMELKLLGGRDAKKRRETLSQSLGIGYGNGKTMYNKLRMFRITKEQILEHLKE